MFRESPVAIPLTFENTKYPAIEERMKTLLENREEVLASHELARSRMADRQKSTFTLFKKRDKVWLNSRNPKQPITKRWNQNKKAPSPSQKF